MCRFCLLLLASLVGCLLFPTSHDEVSRVASPSGRLDAVLVETNGGATTDFGYLVYVVAHRAPTPNRGELAWLYGAGRSTRAYGANLKWESESRLRVEYLEAKEAEVRRERLVLGSDTVRIALRSGVADSMAPAGGMLYNLEKGRR
jgi:hypothetical protein